MKLLAYNLSLYIWLYNSWQNFEDSEVGVSERRRMKSSVELRTSLIVGWLGGLWRPSSPEFKL
jgi:hypothetical protein